MSLMLDDEVALGNDSRYKSFITAIEKVLNQFSQFEYSTDWADLIPHLNKLKKTIEDHSQFHCIPKRLTLLKCLAQCLHPALPSGIHIKSLEVYETIFQMLDKRSLQRDIILYSYGLFPLFPLAALSVKPVLLTLFEKYFLPLGEALNPILTGFLIGLFSALEEGAEYYNRVIKLLDDLADRFDEFYFYTCIWSAIHLVASVRYPAITFILNHFDKRKNMKDQMDLIGLSIETMVSAVCTCLFDNEQSLVQRAILDFLLICLPMHKNQLRNVNMMKIITASFHILLKRDISLNRRIYTWFLGTNELCKDNPDQQYQINEQIDSSSYFMKYTQEILIESLRTSLDIIAKNAVLSNVKSDPNDNKLMTDIIDLIPTTWTLPKLIRVLLVLVETSDVGPNIIKSIFMNYLLLVYEQAYYPAKISTSTNIQQENYYSETLKTFNMLLDTLEPYFIWEFLTKNFDYILNQQQDKKSITAGCTIEQICGIILMLLDIFSVESSTDSQSEHLAEMLYRLIKIINNNIEKLSPNQITLCIETFLKIFKNFIPSNTNHYLSAFPRSSNQQHQILDSNLTDSDTEDDNEYATDIYNKLSRTDSTDKVQNPDLLIEQQCLNDIERLLRQMVRKVEKQVYKLNNSFSDERKTRLSSKTILESMNYIEKSIKLYKIFFHQFIITYLIDRNQGLLNEKFQSICSIIQNRIDDNLLTIFSQYREVNELHLKLHENVEHYKAAFEECCKLLVEFCCFQRQLSINDQPLLSTGKTDFDDWSMDLCILSLCKSDHFPLQTISISVLIEIFGYTLNFYTTSTKKSIDIVTNSPSFTESQVSFLLNETDFFQYIIAYFWEYLSDKYSCEYNLKASFVLSILHSMLPNNVCEDLICNRLSLINIQQSETEIKSVDGYQRFFKLWNSTRSAPNITNKHLTKSFQRCLICVLSILTESDKYFLKPMVQQWTYDCFVHGDMCRIFDILLIMLLHSDTTRISIQRLDPIVHKDFFLDQQIDSNLNNNTDDMNEITFALTFDAENNEDYDDDYATNDENEQVEKDDEKRIRTISYTNSGETVYHIKSSPQTIKFPSFSSLSQPILSNIRSLSPPAFIRSSKPRAPTVSTVSSRNSIHELYASTSPRTQSMPIDTIINESNSLPLNDSIDVIDGYILLYTQSYDYNRVILSLNIIENLIDLIPQQLIHTLLITSNIQSSPINTHNTHMHELFLKHRRSIEEKDFDLSNENNQEYQSYLYLILNILLLYTYSYYPKCFNIEENRKIHIRSLILLTRICHDLSYICMDKIILIHYVVHLFKKVSFQKIILCLFNRILNKKSVKFIYDYYNEYSNDQLIKQYLKQLIQLLEEIILLENIIYSTDLNLIHQPTANQPIFLSTILGYLKQICLIENHRYIISLVGRILPHCGSALKTISTRVIEQICRNLCFVVQYYNQQDTKIKYPQLSSFDAIDYIIYFIQRLSYICNYCLGNTVNNPQHFTQTLCPQYWMKRIAINTNDLSDARQSILNKFPLIVSSILFIWNTISISQTNSIWSETNIKQIRESIVEFVASLTKSNGISFLRAVARCWGERKQQQKVSTVSRDNIGERQALINILMNINNFTINDMIYNMNEFIRTQSITNHKKKQNYVIWSLQFLFAYLEQPKNVSLDCWSTLSVLLKECLSQSISPFVTFLIIKILSFYVKQSPSLVEKRDLKELQEITMKVLETCNTIVASSLEQTKWLRKNLQVRLTQSDSETAPTTTDSPNETDRVSDDDTSPVDFDNTSQSAHLSLIALTILAEHAPKLLDIVYNSTDEKDRVAVSYLQNLVVNLMPYVRTHVASNAPSYRSASMLLMNISQYSYTRKAWKKEVSEQLFDASFFQVDLSTLRSWKIIIGNMVTNEKPFRDVMDRIKKVQTGLFISKEQEYEQRAMLMKRFAFIIYASEKDQYNRYLPEILECIVNQLKLSQVPILHTQMFLFLRVLLLRISSKNLMSFWPILMAELIQVLLQLEQDLLSDIEGDIKSHVQRMTINDIALTNISASNPSLKMYLYACKLLDVLLAMPCSELYHFQLFRSAFTADHGTINQNSNVDTFITFSVRLSKLFEQKLQSMPTSIRDNLPIINHSRCPLLRLKTLPNIVELFPFFNYLVRMPIYDTLCLKPSQILLSDKLSDIEISVLEDFVESWL